MKLVNAEFNRLVYECMRQIPDDLNIELLHTAVAELGPELSYHFGRAYAMSMEGHAVDFEGALGRLIFAAERACGIGKYPGQIRANYLRLIRDTSA